MRSSDYMPDSAYGPEYCPQRDGPLPDTRDLTGRLMGDPVFERSALLPYLRRSHDVRRRPAGAS